MATHITLDCINCDACVSECPNGAITDGSDVGAEVYFIHPNLCNECVGFHAEEACQTVCPVSCCLPDPANMESEEVLVARGLELHPDDLELKARIDSGNFPSLKRK